MTAGGERNGVLNPWTTLGAAHIHPGDEYAFRLHNAKARPAYQIERGLPPLPYLGDPRTARVVLLAKNASYSEQDEADAERLPELFTENEKALTFQSAHPFFYLDPRFEGTAGHAWWSQVLGPLLDAAAGARPGLTRADAARHVACLQSHPYRSRDSFDPKEPFPTQEYTDHLAREAAARPGVVFVMMGGAVRWSAVVPQLAKAPVVRLKNAQKPYVSPGNVKAPDDFARLVAALIAAADA